MAAEVLMEADLRKGLSIYLDLLRLLAALGVLAGHARHLLVPWEPGPLGAQAAECVAIFFVLSGFVIAFVTAEKERSWQAYAGARFARIMSVVVPAIVLCFVLDRIGTHVNMAPYLTWKGWNLSPSPLDLLSYLTFTNEIWFRHAVIGTLEPYWSLGFEVLYYAFFGIVFFARGWWRGLGLVAWAAVVGPKIIVFLPVWLIGVGLYWMIRRRTTTAGWHAAAGAGLMLLSVIFYYLLKYKLFKAHVQDMYIHGPNAELFRSCLYYYLLGLIVSTNVYGFDLMVGARDVWAAGVTKVIRWLAGGTFSIYLLHLPMVVFVAAVFPAAAHSRPLGAAAVVVILLAIYGMAEIGERRKRPYRKLADAILLRSRKTEPAFAVPPVDV